VSNQQFVSKGTKDVLLSMKRSGTNARIDGIRSTSLADAMGRAFSHRSRISGLLSPTPERVLFGPAVTVQYVLVREDLRDASEHEFAAIFYDCISEGAAGEGTRYGELWSRRDFSGRRCEVVQGREP